MQVRPQGLVDANGVPIGPGGRTEAENIAIANQEREDAKKAAQKLNMMNYEITTKTSNIRCDNPADTRDCILNTDLHCLTSVSR